MILKLVACTFAFTSKVIAAEGKIEIKMEELFDSSFYAKAYNVAPENALVHYLGVGHKDGNRPNTWFDKEFYLRDLSSTETGSAPLVQYARHLQDSLRIALEREWDFAIIGAGYAGSVVANKLANAGYTVALFDKKPFLGGHAHDYYDEHGVLVHLCGPHIFHTNDKKVFEFLSQFTDWRFYEHRVKAQVEGKLYPMPINRTTINMLYGLSLETEKECQDYLNAVRVPKEQITTSEDVVLSIVGKDLCDKFFRNYTRKQWGRDLSELSPDVLRRIPTRTNEDDRYFTDTYQFMPLNGYTKMFQRMVSHKNIALFLGIDYLPLRKQVKAKHVVCTGPIDAFYDFKFGPLPYRSLNFQFEFVPNVDLVQPVGTVNYPNDYDFTRITEFKHLTGQKIQGSTLLKEYPKDSNETQEPFYPILCKENEEIMAKYAEAAKAEKNITFVGRLAEYKYYNMDQVTASALAAADSIIARHKN